MRARLVLLFVVAVLCIGCAHIYRSVDDFKSGSVQTSLQNVRENYQKVYRNLLDMSDKCLKEQWGDNANTRSNLFPDGQRSNVTFYYQKGIVAHVELEQKGDETTLWIYYEKRQRISPDTILKWAQGFSVCH